jgi:hypothetical protein
MGHEWFGMKGILGVALVVAVWIGYSVWERLRDKAVEERLKKARGDSVTAGFILDEEMARRKPRGDDTSHLSL